jgi:tRNA A-37 threonylcarbamoyl transferase component Bud32
MQNTSDISLHSLRHIHSHDVTPFTITLNDSDDTLESLAVLRVLPGKRLVMTALWKGKEVIAKLFYQRHHARRHLLRDYHGIQGLLSAAVLSPAILFKGTAKNTNVHVLIFEKINGVSLESIWQTKKNIPSIMPTLQAMAIELATQHVLGVLQHDLHFKNFLVNKKRIYTIDGGAIELFDKPLSKQKSIKNLALFFSQLGVNNTDLYVSLYKTYACSRGWLIKQKELLLIDNYIKRYHRSRWQQYKQKIMRTCSAFVLQKSMFKTVLYDRDYISSEFTNLLMYPDKLMAAGETLKSGNTTTVVKVLIDNKPMVVKRYNLKSISHWLRRCLRPTRAMTGWKLSQRLRLLDVNTAKPIAAIDTHFFALRGKSYLVTDYIDGIDAGVFFDSSASIDEKIEVANKIVALLKSLFSIQTTHGDLKKTNILIVNCQPFFIDLDGMHHHTSQLLFKKAVKRDINRFMRNWENNLPIRSMFTELLKSVSDFID